MITFDVTYEITTPEDAEIGEPGEIGFAAMGVTLREAVRELGGHAHEANEWPIYAPRWLTNSNYNEDFATGGVESRSLHIPNTVTASSRKRLARLLGVRG